MATLGGGGSPVPPPHPGQGWSRGPSPTPPPVPLGDPPVLLPRGWHCPGPPVGYGVTCTPPRPPRTPTAEKVLGINNAHCFPLMNITDLPGRQLRAPAGGAGASPASPRPGTPPSPGPPGVPPSVGKSTESAPAFTPSLPATAPAVPGVPQQNQGVTGGCAGAEGGVPGGGPCPSSPPPVSLNGVWPRSERGWFVLGEKLPQPRGCLEHPGPAELQGDPSSCPQLLSPAHSDVPCPRRGQDWSRGQPRAGIRPGPRAGTNSTGVCDRGLLAHRGSSLAPGGSTPPQRHEGGPGPGDSCIPTACAPRHGQGQGDALPWPRASLRRTPHSSLPALPAINPLPGV